MFHKCYKRFKDFFKEIVWNMQNCICEEYLEEIQRLQLKVDELGTKLTVFKGKLEKLQQEDRIIVQKIESETISSEELEERIRDKFKGVEIHTLDTKYRVAKNRTEIKEKLDNQDFKLKYYSNFFDCENYAFMEQSMMAFKHLCNSVGVVISYRSSHAYNIVVTANDIFLYEPQTQRIIEAGTEMYKTNYSLLVI